MMGEAIKQIAKGNTAAETFCHLWVFYCHHVDDVIDGDLPHDYDTKQAIIEAMALQSAFLSSDYYVNNRASLYPVVVVSLSDYAISVAWETSKVEWQQRAADLLRSNCNQVLTVVALLEGGYQHAKEMGKLLAEISWKDQRLCN